MNDIFVKVKVFLKLFQPIYKQYTVSCVKKCILVAFSFSIYILS